MCINIYIQCPNTVSIYTYTHIGMNILYLYLCLYLYYIPIYMCMFEVTCHQEKQILFFFFGSWTIKLEW